MSLFPPIPTWDQLHPIVVHFPIALLVIAPAAVLAAVIFKGWTRHLLVVSAATVVIGTGFAALATATGDAAEGAAKGVAGADQVLHRHEELAELARNVFIGLGAALVLFAGVVCRLGDRLPRALTVTGTLIYLAAHLVGTVILANAAHEGGVLVHRLGVRAWAAGAPTPAGVDPAARRGHDNDD